MEPHYKALAGRRSGHRGGPRHAPSALEETGIVFHLLGALSQFGKIGLTAIGSTPDEAELFYQRAKQADLETSGDWEPASELADSVDTAT
jgi:hypothetical protein